MTGGLLTRGRWPILIACMATAGTAACDELYKGPRVVPYTDTSFYVRHIPLVDSARTADQTANDICSRQQSKAILRDAYQDVPLDIRYATYECI